MVIEDGELMTSHTNTEGSRHEDARLFSSMIPGLFQREASFWESSARREISFPAGGHASLAAVEQTSYWFNHRNTVIKSVVKRFPPEGMIVDIGGGNGYVSLGLKEAGFDSLVVEPGSSGANCAHGRGLPVIMAPYESLQVAPGSIAAAGLFDVLEHIDDDAGALRQLHAAIKPEGMLYLTVPAFNCLWSSEDVHAGHFRRYTIKGCSDLLTAQGFEVAFATYFFSALVAPIFVLRSIPTRLHLKTLDAASSTGNDHKLPEGLAGKAMSRHLQWEARRIAQGKNVRFGSSCLLVARRVQRLSRPNLKPT